MKPSADETHTDLDGRFRVTTVSPAIVIRAPGYESQRLRVAGDAEVTILLQEIKAVTGCKLSTRLSVKTKESNDVDYTATWFYIETKDGPKGMISGSGPS